jgi:hypothetical protein
MRHDAIGSATLHDMMHCAGKPVKTGTFAYGCPQHQYQCTSAGTLLEDDHPSWTVDQCFERGSCLTCAGIALKLTLV